jgi:hypothetical protein
MLSNVSMYYYRLCFLNEEQELFKQAVTFICQSPEKNKSGVRQIATPEFGQ